MKPLSETPRTDAAEEESFGFHNNSLSARAAGWEFARKLEIDRDYYEKALRSAENLVLNYLRDKERLEREINALKAEPASIVHQCRIDDTPTANDQTSKCLGTMYNNNYISS